MDEIMILKQAILLVKLFFVFLTMLADGKSLGPQCTTIVYMNVR